jgi:hypothetical protein
MSIFDQIDLRVNFLKRLEADVNDAEISFANGEYYAAKQMFIELKERLVELKEEFEDFNQYYADIRRREHKPLKIVIKRCKTLIDTCSSYIK